MKLRKIYAFTLLFTLMISQFSFIVRSAYDKNTIFESNKRIYESKSTDKRLLATYYLMPTFEVQSDNPAIIKFAVSIINDGTEGHIVSDYEKLELLHDWVTENIWYDWDAYADKSYINNPNDAVDTLKTKKGVCSGYSRLLIALLRAVDIPAKYIVGETYNNGGNDAVHAWVEAFVDDRWVIVDVTWNSVNRYEDSNFSVQSPGKRTWFDSTVEEFSAKHIYRDYSEIYFVVDSVNHTLKSVYMDSMVEYVSIPNGIENIGSHVFDDGYTNIKSIEFSEDMSTIGAYAFEYLTSLEFVAFGQNLKHIGNYAFAGCTSLADVEFPQNLVSIGKSAFSGCSSLRNVEIPSDVYIIGTDAFADCVNIENLTANSDYLNRFSDSLSNLKTVNLQEGSLIIPKDAFKGCKSLTTVNMPNTVRHIGDDAFSGCITLAEANLSPNITTIGAGAFKNCRVLPSLILSNNLRGVDENAFDGCSALILTNKSNLSETVRASEYRYLNTPNRESNLPDVSSVRELRTKFKIIGVGVTAPFGNVWNKLLSSLKFVSRFKNKFAYDVWKDTNISIEIPNAPLGAGLSNHDDIKD